MEFENGIVINTFVIDNKVRNIEDIIAVRQLPVKESNLWQKLIGIRKRIFN